MSEQQLPEYPYDHRLTRIELLNRIHNEQLDQLVRIEVDSALLTRMVIQNPSDKESVARQANLDRALVNKKELLSIIGAAIEKELEAGKK